MAIASCTSNRPQNGIGRIIQARVLHSAEVSSQVIVEGRKDSMKKRGSLSLPPALLPSLSLSFSLSLFLSLSLSLSRSLPLSLSLSVSDP